MAHPMPARPRMPALRDYQARTLQSLLRGMARYAGATFTVMYPRQAGKNEVAAALVACLLRSNARRGGSVVVCAPTFSPQGAISLDRARRALAYSEHLLGDAGRAELRGDTIVAGRARAIFLSASPAAHVAGHTASLALIADEAQDIEADWFNRQFRPMAASTGAPVVLFGTAWDGHTLLEEAATRNRERDHSLRAKGLAGFEPFHHQVSWQEVAATNAAYGRYVRGERVRLGARHPLFLSQYELVAAETTGRLLTGELVARLAGSHERLEAPRGGERYVAGLDFAGEGAGGDRTVLTIARVAGDRCEVVALRAWRGAPYAEVVADVGRMAGQWRFERLCADASGLGSPLVAQLAPVLGHRLEAFVFSAQSKSELGYGLIAAAETGRLTLHAAEGSSELDACVSELLGCRAALQAGRRLWWEAAPGSRDDYVVSLALCVRAAAQAGAPRLAVGRGP